LGDEVSKRTLPTSAEDRDVIVTNCGRICLHRKKISLSLVLASKRLGIKEFDEGIWLVSFMHYHFGFIDLEQSEESK
jgi:hypothetical protein